MKNGVLRQQANTKHKLYKVKHYHVYIHGETKMEGSVLTVKVECIHFQEKKIIGFTNLHPHITKATGKK